MTQTHLGALVGKTRAHISFIERTGKVNHLTYLQILKALGLMPYPEEEDPILGSIAESSAAYSQHAGATIDYLKSEIKTLREIIELQKTVIEMLKKNQ